MCRCIHHHTSRQKIPIHAGASLKWERWVPKLQMKAAALLCQLMEWVEAYTQLDADAQMPWGCAREWTSFLARTWQSTVQFDRPAPKLTQNVSRFIFYMAMKVLRVCSWGMHSSILSASIYFGKNGMGIPQYRRASWARQWERTVAISIRMVYNIWYKKCVISNFLRLYIQVTKQAMDESVIYNCAKALPLVCAKALPFVCAKALPFVCAKALPIVPYLHPAADQHASWCRPFRGTSVYTLGSRV